MADSAALPPELERAVKLAHRSPTYGITLTDGRSLLVRREAIAIRADGTEDLKKLARGAGEVRWWARCGNCETTGAELGDVLIRTLGIGRDKDQDFDAWWDEIRMVVCACLSLAEAAVPCEQQAVAA